MKIIRTLIHLLVTKVARRPLNYRGFSDIPMSSMWKTDLPWIDLSIAPDNLRISNSLNMGQCFNWKELPGSNGNEWIGCLHGRAFAVRQSASSTWVAELTVPRSNEDTIRTLFMDYFQTNSPLEALYEKWASRCARMKVVTAVLPGVRVLRQDPWECLISFICSSNNNISRISQMVYHLRKNYGRFLCSVRSTAAGWVVEYDYREADPVLNSPAPKRRRIAESDDVKEVLNDESTFHIFSFPSPQELSLASEENLRKLGMGYRAKFIVGATLFVIQQNNLMGKDWLLSLRLNDGVAHSSNSSEHRLRVQEALMQLPGVGRKVADCVALFSLDQDNAIPVDTHVWSIATRDYAPHLKGCKSLTPKIYEQVGDVFRHLFEEKAGWAHSVLFAAELPQFKPRLAKFASSSSST